MVDVDARQDISHKQRKNIYYNLVTSYAVNDTFKLKYNERTGFKVFTTADMSYQKDGNTVFNIPESAILHPARQFPFKSICELIYL